MIVGAGLAGLIAAHAFPNYEIVEAAEGPKANHRAVLRFRGTAVSSLTGIEFRPVTVRKGIWEDGGWVSPNITSANAYSRKVIDRLVDRSIWNLESVTRYIAPENFYERLLEHSQSRITWGEEYDYSLHSETPVISTAPMPVVMDSLRKEKEGFSSAGITVKRFRIPKCDVFQTVYFPDDDHSMYRASITGNLLICEFIGEAWGDWEIDVAESFGISDLEKLEDARQNYGKIAPINEEYRRYVVAELTDKKNIYSLGRFATWRNILLDDVANDITVIKRLITNNTKYERRMLWQK